MARSRFPIAIPTASLLALLFLTAAACSGNGGDDQPEAGIRVISAADAAEVQADPPEGLVVLDVRTLEEFDAGHLADATMIDFYQPDFADRIAELDRDAPYLLYCRSGNRSGQTRELMESLGFTNVADVDGGILAWAEAGLPVQ